MPIRTPNNKIELIVPLPANCPAWPMRTQPTPLPPCNRGCAGANTGLRFHLRTSGTLNSKMSPTRKNAMIVAIPARWLSATAVTCDEAETMGINSRAELARAEAAFQARKRAEALETGVTLVAPDTVQFAYDTWLGRDSLVEPYVVFGAGVATVVLVPGHRVICCRAGQDIHVPVVIQVDGNDGSNKDEIG